MNMMDMMLTNFDFLSDIGTQYHIGGKTYKWVISRDCEEIELRVNDGESWDGVVSSVYATWSFSEFVENVRFNNGDIQKTIIKRIKIDSL